MKKGILLFVMIAGLTIVGCKGDAKTETEANTESKATIKSSSKGKELSMSSFGVRGNCGMCKETIEKAAKSVKGVAEATWDVKKKSITISYDEYVVNENVVHKAIAAAGYDTNKVKGDREVYTNLPKCCQYSDEQLMNLE